MRKHSPEYLTDSESDAMRPYSAYRDSGVDWLGEVPAHWEVRRLRTVAEIRVSNIDKHVKDGERPVRLCNYVDVYKNDHIRPGMEFMRATATPGEIERFRLQRGDVLITKDSESWNDIGVPALVESTEDDIVCGYHLALLRPISDYVGGGYLFRALQSSGVAHQLQVEANGVTRFGLTHGGIKSIWLPLPSLAEQAAIVRFLDHVDRRIRRYVRAKQKLIAVLEEQKQVFIQQAVTGRIDVRTGRPYPKYKPSGVEWLGHVPENWQVWRSKRVFVPRRELARPDDIQLSATQAYGVIAQEEYEKRVGRKVVRILQHLEQRQHVEVDDFVISMRSFQGGLEKAWETGCIRSSYIVLQPATRLIVGYFGRLFKSTGYVTALRSTANFIRDGQDLNFENFCRVDLPFPPLEEQQKISVILDRTVVGIDSAIDRWRRQIALLGEYRTRLIADVVTGKLDVRRAAAGLPAVDALGAEDDVETFGVDATSESEGFDTAVEEVEA